MLSSSSEVTRSVRALHHVLAKTRYLALHGASTQDLVTLLDWAERLADDIGAFEDSPGQFLKHLQGLGEDFPEFAGLAREYAAAVID